jgi:ribosomal protein S18 acetylase RimI-like enzyme
MRIAPLRAADRARLSQLLVSTGAFNAEEVQVALSLFDLSMDELDGRAGTVPGAPSATSVADDPMDYEFIGAYDGERLMGYACFGPTPSTEGTFDLYWLAVDPVAQGRGVGRAMLGDVERRLAERGARLLVAETSGRPDYAATRAFYLATGYTVAATVKDFYAPADDRIMLHRRLTTRERGVATR